MAICKSVRGHCHTFCRHKDLVDLIITSTTIYFKVKINIVLLLCISTASEILWFRNGEKYINREREEWKDPPELNLWNPISDNYQYDACVWERERVCIFISCLIVGLNVEHKYKSFDLINATTCWTETHSPSCLRVSHFDCGLLS